MELDNDKTLIQKNLTQKQNQYIFAAYEYSCCQKPMPEMKEETNSTAI